LGGLCDANNELWRTAGGRIQRLDPVEQLRLLEELAALVRSRMASQPRARHSILELQGLGKKIWQDIDAQEFI